MNTVEGQELNEYESKVEISSVVSSKDSFFLEIQEGLVDTGNQNEKQMGNMENREPIISIKPTITEGDQTAENGEEMHEEVKGVVSSYMMADIVVPNDDQEVKNELYSSNICQAFINKDEDFSFNFLGGPAPATDRPRIYTLSEWENDGNKNKHMGNILKPRALTLTEPFFNVNFESGKDDGVGDLDIPGTHVQELVEEAKMDQNVENIQIIQNEGIIQNIQDGENIPKMTWRTEAQ